MFRAHDREMLAVNSLQGMESQMQNPSHLSKRKFRETSTFRSIPLSIGDSAKLNDYYMHQFLTHSVNDLKIISRFAFPPL